MALTVLIVLAGGVLAYSLSRGSGSSIVGASPKQVIALVTSAVQKAGSVHVVTSVQAAQGGRATYVNDTSTNSGRQVITYSGAQVTALVVDGTAYVNINQLAMTSLFQAPAGVAQQFANKWLYFRSSDQAYKTITETLTLGSLLQQVTPTGAVSKLAPTVINGRSVIGLRGELPGKLSGTLYVSATGSPLPVEEISPTASGTTTAIFSSWGEPVNVTPPAGATSGSAAGLS